MTPEPICNEAILKLSVAFKLTLEQHYHTSLETIRQNERKEELVLLRRMFCAYVCISQPNLPLKISQTVLQLKSHASIKHLIAVHNREIQLYPFYLNQYDLFAERFTRCLNSDQIKQQLQTFKVLMEVYNKQFEHIQNIVLAK